MILLMNNSYEIAPNVVVVREVLDNRVVSGSSSKKIKKNM